MDAPHQTLSDILQDSLQKNDHALLFASDIAGYSDETQHAVVADLLLEAVCSGAGHWKAALSYLQHALAVGLAPVNNTLAALLTRLPGLQEDKLQVHLGCLHTLEEFLPMLCLERDGKADGLEDGPSFALGTLELLLSACTTLLGGVLQRADEEQRLMLPGQGEELEAVRIALRTVHKLLEGRKTGPLLRLGQKASPPSWSHLRGQMDALACAVPALPGDQKHLSEVLLASWRRLQSPPSASVHLVSAMQAGRAGWRPWAVGSAKAWLPLEVLLEDMVEGKKLPHTTAADALAGVLRVLRSIEGASWVDALLALWLAALRSVQRGHEEQFHTETRLSLLLAIVPMAIQAVLAPPPPSDPTAAFLVDDLMDATPAPSFASLPAPPSSSSSSDAATPHDLAACLDLLHHFPLLLPAPPAASAAADRVSPTLRGAQRGAHGGPPPSPLSSPLPSPSTPFFTTTPMAPPLDPPASPEDAGDLRDLVVDACTARALVLPSDPTPAPSPPAEPPPAAAAWGAVKSPWEQLMAGAALTASLRAAILATPASRREELERVYQIAVGGHDTDEQAAAASTLCGASLVRGWAIQEHAVRLAIQLLTPPHSDDSTLAPPAGPASPFRYLVNFAPMLFAALAALSQSDTLEIVRLHGQLPHLAAALLPIADVFGDMPAGSASSAATADDLLVHSIFSQAFLLLSRILETFASPATASSPSGPLSLSGLLDLAAATPSPVLPAPTLAHFPRVAAWYRDHGGFSRPPACDSWRPRVTEQLLRMLFPPDSKAAGGSGQRKTPSEPVLASAWDVMAAAPELGSTLLNACASGRLAAKDLAQGLRSLLVYLPAVAVPLAHYFIAEVVRGAWRPAVLNGTEWPSPASRLPAMEADITALLRHTAVLVGGGSGEGGATHSAHAHAAYGNTVPTVPLPLAAALSLVLAGTGDMSEGVASAVVLPLLRCSAAQPWPTLPICAALMAPVLRHSAKQLAPTAAALWCAVSRERTRAVVESCFRTALHPTLERPSGITSLLGESRLFGVRDPTPLSPGAMYIRTAPHCSEGTAVASDVAARVLAQASGKRGIAGPGSESRDAPAGPASAAKRLRCRQDSLREALPVVTQAAGLGACLVAMAGRDAVRALFVDVLPPLLADTATGRDGRGGDRKGGFCPYALARLVVLSGLLAWGQTPGPYAGQALEEHVEFLVGAEGPAPTWTGSSFGAAYLVALASLLAGHAPAWLGELGNETLLKLSRGVAAVGARDLALRVLECGKSSNVAAFGELIVGLR